MCQSRNNNKHTKMNKINKAGKVKLVLFFLLVIIINLRVCSNKKGGIYSNEQLIKYFSNEIVEFKHLYSEIINCIDTIKTKNSEYVIRYNPNFDYPFSLNSRENGQIKFYYDFRIPKSLKSNFSQRSIGGLTVVVNRNISFRIRFIDNIDSGEVFLIYLYGDFENIREEYYDKYKVYKNKQLPKEDSGWIYQIDENWAIFSRPYINRK